MKAVVLAGGLGTRMRPYTFTVPKPLLPLGDRPLLDYIITHLAQCGIRDIVLALGYQAQLIRESFKDGAKFGVRISYVEETRPLGTAGPLALCRPLLNAKEPAILMNGDILTRLDFQRLRAFHDKVGAQLTIAYVRHTYQSPFGVLQLTGDEVTGIVEKPTYVHPVSAGIYCLSPKAVALVPPDSVLSMPELALRVRAEGGKVAACEITEFWRALETRDHLEQLQNDEATLKQLLEP